MTRSTARFASLALAGTLAMGGALAAAAPAFAEPLPELEGSVSIAGTPQVGNTLEVVVAGWPADTEFTYEWFFTGGSYVGGIPAGIGTSYVVEGDYIRSGSASS